jgi:hypothetical protein
MTSKIVCRIGGVDYGSAGQNLLMSLDSVSPMGPGGVGTATIGLRKTGGGITITNQQVVELYEQEIGTNKIPRSYIMGIVNRRRTGVMRGTNIKVWAIDTVDVNDALDGIVGNAKVGITVAAGTFTAQIASIYTQAISTGTPVVTLDYASGILDPTGGATLPAVTFNGRTLRQMIQDRCNALQTINTALRMKFHIGPDTNPNRTTFGGPILYTYDAAATAPFIALWFTDTPASGKISIAQAVEFGRIVEGAKLIQKRQVLVKATGGIFTGASDSAVITTYKYPYSGDGARWGELVEDSQSLTDAAGQVAITRAVRSTGTPRETIQLSAYAYALPGQYVKLDWALEGLAGAIYSLAAVSVDFRNWRNPLTTFTLGARRLMLGENPDLDEMVMPIERDTIPPAKPLNWRASPASTYNPTTRMSTVFLAFDGPQENDLQQVEVLVSINGVLQPMIPLIRGVLTLAIVMLPSATWTAYASARDTSGNKSEPTATLTGTAAAWVAEVPGPPATVTLSGLRTGPATWQANVSWTVGTGGTGVAASYEVRYYPTASGSANAIIRPVPNDNRTYVITDLAIAVPYTINVRSVTANQERGGWSTGSAITFARDLPASPTGLNVLAYDPGQTGQGAYILFGWTPGVGGTGAVATWNIRVDWTESSTGIVRKLHFNGIPVANVNAVLAPLTPGLSYTIIIWGITAFGDSSDPASTTYTIATPIASLLPNPDFEEISLADSTKPARWARTDIPGTVGTWDRYTTDSYAGLACLRINHANTAIELDITSNPFVVEPGTIYQLTGYTKGSSANNAGGRVEFHFYDKTGAEISFIASGSINVTTAWAPFSVTAAITAPALAVQGRIMLASLPKTLPTPDATWVQYWDALYLRKMISTSDVIDATVTTPKLAAGSVTSTVLGNDSVTAAAIAAGAVGPTELATGTLDKPHWGSLMAALQKTTSNPGSPASGDSYLNTTSRRIGIYDGARWLSIAPVPLPWLPNATLNPYSVSGVDAWYSILPNDMALYLERWTSLVRGNTTNNATNYWTIALQGFTGGVGTTLDSFNTSGLTVNVLSTQHRALTVALTAGQYDFLAIIATKTNAPGTLLLIPHLRAREILT